MVIMKNNKSYANIAGPVSVTSYENAVKQAIVGIMNEEKNSKTLINNYSNFVGG
jgi:hypothetical protein